MFAIWFDKQLISGLRAVVYLKGKCGESFFRKIIPEKVFSPLWAIFQPEV